MTISINIHFREKISLPPQTTLISNPKYVLTVLTKPNLSLK